MHKLFLNYGKYNFVQQIPQITYSTIISSVIEIFLCYLSLTDKYFYLIKSNFIKGEKNNMINISFSIGLIYPIFLYFISASLRYCSLTNKKNSCKCIYNLSYMIPFF